MHDLIARLDDTEVRLLLLERLDAAARAAAQEGEGELGDFWLRSSDETETLRNNFLAMILSASTITDAVPAAIDQLRNGRPHSSLVWIALGFALMLAVGWVAELFAKRALRGLRQQRSISATASPLSNACSLLFGLFLDFVVLGVFVVAALLVFLALTHGSATTRGVVMTYMGAVATVRAVAILARFLLAPSQPELRLERISDSDARFLYRQSLIMACIGAFGFLTCRLLLKLGLPIDLHHLLTFSVGLVLIATVVYTLGRARAAITGDLAWEPETAGKVRLMLAAAWPSIAITYTILLYAVIVVVTLAGGQGSYLASFGSLTTVILLPHFDAILERAARRMQDQPSTFDTLGGQVKVVAVRSSRIVLFIATGLFLAKIWGVDLSSFAEESFGARLAGALVDIGLTVLIAFVLWQLARIAIDRRLAEEGIDGEEATPEPGEQGGKGASRMRTLLPLMRAVAKVTIAVMAVMLVLSALGVNIGPLLAGAGVIGLAVGFGAQTLVRDIVSGVFFLVDDAFRTGEYIDVGVVKGTVEKISLRSLRLRHHRGALHTVPFGEIQHLTNYSRDWAIMKLEFRVPFDTDLEKVRKIFKKIGQDLMADEELAPGFIQPFKSQGVLATDDSAFVLRGKFMAKPGAQFLIRRSIFQAVQKAFAAEGIKFADRRVTVNVPGAEDMDHEERATIEKAAASAVAAADAAAAKAAPAQG